LNLSDACGSVSSGVSAIIVDRDAIWYSILNEHPTIKKEVLKLSREYPKKRSLNLDYRVIEAYGFPGISLADEILDNPLKTMKDVQDCILVHSLVSNQKTLNIPIHVRFFNLPRKTSIPDIRENLHVGKLVTIEGIVRKSSEVRSRLTIAVFRCRAGHRTTRIQGPGPIKVPQECSADGCNQTRLEFQEEFSQYVDTQRVKIQESPEGAGAGSSLETIDCQISDDICGIIKAGDRVCINGIVKRFQRGQSTTFDRYLEVVSIEIQEKEFGEITISEDDEKSIRELSKEKDVFIRFFHSISPSIYGMDDIKKAIVLQLFGGVPKNLPDGSRLRGDIHVLLIGDPGSGKSQVIRYVTKIAPRSIFTSGKSSSSAGLTATAVKDEFDGRWTLEAGAMVLADMGVLALDEIDKMNSHDRSSLHEAMEQQSLSVAKAGICATLLTRTSVLAAANPKLGRFDNYLPIAEQINMPPSLLSRFDLIYLVTDKPETTHDTKLANHILSAHSTGTEILKAEHEKREPVILENLVLPPIHPVLMRKYIAYAKRIIPVLTPEAKLKLQNYFVSVRSEASEGKPVPITARQIEALIRLAEASARVRLSETVDERDAELVIHIVDQCLRKVAYDPKTGELDSDRWGGDKPKSTRDLIKEFDKTYDRNQDADGWAEEAVIFEILLKSGHARSEVERIISEKKRIAEFTEKKGKIRRI
jgi:replicative DNA helicase Mcm